MNDPKDTRGGSTGTTWLYTCDRGGNLLTKKAYPYTTGGTLGTVQQTIAYTYGDSNWKDKLTAYNGTTLSYDAIGNLTNDGTWAYTWICGRQLRRMYDGTTDIYYGYDHNGLRVSKNVNGTVTNYTTTNGKLTHMKRGSEYMHIFYDGQGRASLFNKNGVKYTYIYNLQGDVVGLLDESGTLVVEYKYDAWGKLLGTTGSLASTIGKFNPLRYRGYVYDEETGLYYLRSRYYNPEWGRFISSDGYPWEMNLYSYCMNSPINRSDADGNASYSCFGDLTSDPSYTPDGMSFGGGGYHVDLSMAVNSSLWHSPLLNGEWYGYYVHTPNTYTFDRKYTGTSDVIIPQKAIDVLKHLKTHNYSPMKGYKGGGGYANDGRDGSAFLPSMYAPFYKYDVDPKVKGIPRNKERIVVGRGGGGAAWYTKDHYLNFYLIEKGLEE